KMVFRHLFMLFALAYVVNARMDECRLVSGRPQRCLPPFVNAAFGRTVIADNTCGTPAEEYCLQTGVTGVTKSCHICDSSDPARRHDTRYLTDFNNEDVSTWWQSNTMLHDVQYPTSVNLTLNLTKAFDITYVRLKFHTSRPESFTIYKKKCDDCEWQALQYYSGSCFTTYGLDNKGIVTVDNEQKALCTDDFSDISPLTGGNVAFSTLESRPSAYNFDRSPVLQDWVKAVAIRISLNRINTFGDEVFRDPKVLKSYYYAVSDLSIGGRCACNGHAAECYLNEEDILTCRCQHNTAGRDCDRCADMFNDRPWSRATRDEASECKACDCNGLSNKCYFDPDLYRQTGHGGHCTECRDNTAGAHCELCLPHHYRDPSTNRCVACRCNEIGSTSQQCNVDGQCSCKPGVGGAACDRCMNGFYGLSEAGCSVCRCSVAGTLESSVCDSDTGACRCKANVEGNNCDRCKPGSMNLQESNPYGCTSCFCYGHSSVCQVSPGYTTKYIVSEFTRDDDDWQGQDSLGQPSPVTSTTDGAVAMTSLYRRDTYFVAPEKYLGEQRFSYNQKLEFDGAFGVGSVSPSSEDIVLEGAGMRVSARINAQVGTSTLSGNPLPTPNKALYSFRLHELAEFQPRLSALDFQKLLNQLSSIRIRSTYGNGMAGNLDNVRMKSAERGGNGAPADWVEVCDAIGYEGQFTERCAPGYTRDPSNGGEFDGCVPCNCNGHSAICDPVSGVCNCDHNTVGKYCELCADGFYFNGDESRRGTPQECQPCPCPDGSACAMMDDGDVVCTSCPPGHGVCECNHIGSRHMNQCNSRTGQCDCLPNVEGRSCSRCRSGFWNLQSGNGCDACGCHSIGSSTGECDQDSGQCACLPGVGGQRCDQCLPNYYALSRQGCTACNCNPDGSTSLQCGEDGRCICKEGVLGVKCDQCQENYYDIANGCIECSACYGLVQDA
uniref:Laminin subunit gamma-1 n=1 Tax=Ciona savignyi TaxID=51511 RepID=H2Z3S5_CIOSA